MEPPLLVGLDKLGARLGLIFTPLSPGGEETDNALKPGWEGIEAGTQRYDGDQTKPSLAPNSVEKRDTATSGCPSGWEVPR